MSLSDHPVNDNRRCVYRALLRDPSRTWTVRQLSQAVPTVADGAVRYAVNQLLAEDLLRRVPYQRALTCGLTDKGRQALARLLRGA